MNINDDKMRLVMGDQALETNAETIDQRIEENIQKRELMKLRSSF